MPRKVDRENTSRARNVADSENAVVRLDGTPTDRESESEPGFVRPGLGKRQEHFICAAGRQTTAMILDIDQDAICNCIGVYGNLSPMVRELERVLQQVSQGRKKHVGVDVHRKAGVDIGHSKLAPSGTRLEQCGGPDLINETRQRNEFVPRWHSGGDSYVGKGSINERTQSDQGTLQHRP